MIRFLLVMVLLFMAIATSPAAAVIESHIMLPVLPDPSLEAYEEYFTLWFDLHNVDVLGLANEGEKAAWAAMTVLYLEERLGQPLTIDELMAGAWYSEAGAVWQWSPDHPFDTGTREALAYQVREYCGVGVEDCPAPLLMLALGTGWQAFRYNIRRDGSIPLADNIVVMLQSGLQVHAQARAFGPAIVAASGQAYTCNDIWTTGVLDLEDGNGNRIAWQVGDPVTAGRVVWTGHLPGSIAGYYEEHYFATVAGCGLRWK